MLKYIIGAIPTAIVPFIVMAVLNSLSKNVTTDSTDKFVMRMPKMILIISLPCILIFGFCLYGSIIAKQMGWLTTGVFALLLLIGIVLSFLPVKGLYEYIVDNDTLTSKYFWKLRKSISIKDIDHCVIVNGGIKIYLCDGDKPVMSIENVFQNSDNFIKRIEQENIPIENKTTVIHRDM